MKRESLQNDKVQLLATIVGGSCLIRLENCNTTIESQNTGWIALQQPSQITWVLPGPY